LKKILILGATSAVIEPVIEKLYQEGAELMLAARDIVKLNQFIQRIQATLPTAKSKIYPIIMNVIDFNTHKLLFEEAILQLGSVDCILVAYGQMTDPLTSETQWNEFLQEQNVNYLSVTSYLHPFINYFEAQKKGSIAVITSVAGDRMRRSNYVYGLSKGCLSLYLEALRTRLKPIGIRIVDIKLGFVRSPMTKKMQKHPLLSSPKNVAASITNALNCGCSVVYVPGYWRYIMLIIKLIPSFIFYRLKI